MNEPEASGPPTGSAAADRSSASYQQTAPAAAAAAATDSAYSSRGLEDRVSWRFPGGSATDELFALRSVTEAPQPFAAPAPLFSPGPEVSLKPH